MSGTSKRIPMPPTKLSPQDYARTVGSHLKTREGAVPRIYTDGNGIPTMGTGIALAVSGDGKTYTLRDLNQIGAEISGDPAKPYRFTPEETKRLNDTVGKLNDPTLGADARKAEAQKLIPPHKPGKETADDNKFGFTLSDERIAKQAESAWNDHRERAMKVVRGLGLPPRRSASRSSRMARWIVSGKSAGAASMSLLIICNWSRPGTFFLLSALCW